jgi:hypothetical protein
VRHARQLSAAGHDVDRFSRRPEQRRGFIGRQQQWQFTYIGEHGTPVASDPTRTQPWRALWPPPAGDGQTVNRSFAERERSLRDLSERAASYSFQPKTSVAVRSQIARQPVRH